MLEKVMRFLDLIGADDEGDDVEHCIYIVLHDLVIDEHIHDSAFLTDVTKIGGGRDV